MNRQGFVVDLALSRELYVERERCDQWVRANFGDALFAKGGTEPQFDRAEFVRENPDGTVSLRLYGTGIPGEAAKDAPS